ncbi:transmembrane protease serine 9-like isoform X2 [Toxorhynchites rutilus septentrionalis]|uniref:transmembrane protease serine 9-like isoform X2 n=1 Tax=Toxorhynchites rutilus septentrionalis TaxID=329112 RepID=UPI002478F2A0|nr:transmembrane protease serine 9-like isoform X2 [Toxorhynchites rutilus septentrionalis]
MTQRTWLLLPLVAFGVMCRMSIVSRGILRLDVDRYEGEPCPLKNDGTGVCRKSSQCRQSVRNGERHCEFEGNEPVICCAMPPNVTYEAFTRVVQQACNSARGIDSKFDFHVIGDTVAAQVGEFPFVGLLMYENEQIRCGTSIISERFLLTAAHCITNKTRPIAVLLGTNEATDGDADRYETARVFRHKGYNSLTKQNDIALIELKSPIRMNSHIQPICLHTDLIDLPTTTNMTVMGWGIDNSDKTSNFLLKGTVNPILRSVCQSRFDNTIRKIKLSTNQMCALGDQNINGRATDTCEGDSGGPLVINHSGKYHLVGITSFGFGCGSEYFAGIYTRVSSYLDWIIERVWQK